MQNRKKQFVAILFISIGLIALFASVYFLFFYQSIEVFNADNSIRIKLFILIAFSALLSFSGFKMFRNSQPNKQRTDTLDD